METEIIPFDAAEYLQNRRTQIALLRDAITSGDAHYLANAIGAVARASGGFTQLEKKTGIKRQTLNKSFGPAGNPTLETMLAVLPKLGLDLDFRERADVPEAERRKAARA
jgi:probable addiction module antidote protein